MTRTILIVEDTEPSRDMLEMALMQLPGITVHSVATAEEALDFLASKNTTANITALVTDLNLPRMDGFQLIEAVRAGSDMPIMVISGDNDPRTLDRLARPRLSHCRSISSRGIGFSSGCSTSVCSSN